MQSTTSVPTHTAAFHRFARELGRGFTARFFLFCACVVLLLLPVRMYPGEAEDILSSVSLFGGKNELVCSLDMKITDGKETKERRIEVYFSRKSGATDILVQVISPSFLRNLKFLQHKTGSEDSRWVKTSRGVSRVAASGGDENLFGSDLTTEDVSAVYLEDFHSEVLPEFVLDGIPCIRVRSVPVKTGGSYAAKLYYIEKESFLVRGIDWTAGDGSLLRRYRVQESRPVDGTEFPWVARLENLRSGSFTVLEFLSIQAGKPIPERVFNRGGL